MRRQSDVTVTLVTGLGEPLATWQLSAVVPLSWSVQGVGTPLETLDLSYGGLTPAEPC